MKNLLRVERRHLDPLRGWIFVGTILLFLGSDYALAQCALCRDAVASSSTETREAMNYAIISLAFTPYGVAAAAAWVLSPAVRAYVRARLRRLTRGKTGEGL